MVWELGVTITPKTLASPLNSCAGAIVWEKVSVEQYSCVSHKPGPHVGCPLSGTYTDHFHSAARFGVPEISNQTV